MQRLVLLVPLASALLAPTPAARSVAVRPSSYLDDIAAAPAAAAKPAAPAPMPEEHELEERQMFGMAMWLVRGNMFLGVGLKSERLLVRVCDAP